MTQNIYARKAVESAFLWSCGDVLAQYVGEHTCSEDKKKGPGKWYNPQRTLRSASFAVTVYTPLAVTWYGFLAKQFPGKAFHDVGKKVMADQLVFGPTLCSAFFLVMPMFEFKNPADSVERWKREFWGSLKMNWSVWGPVQILNFALVPPQYWILVCNCVSIPWTAYLAYLNARGGGSGGH